MQPEANLAPAFVIKAEEIPALNFLPRNYPRPSDQEWINRGTNQRLKKSSIDMLLRTLFKAEPSPSVVRLHQSYGLRMLFRSERDRASFANAFAAARKQESVRKDFFVTAIFDSRTHAERAVERLCAAGVAKGAISLLWRAGQYMEAQGKDCQGHTKFSVAGAVAGGGVAGALFGVAILAVPGIGPVAAAGAIAATAYSSVAAVSAAIGATGGAIARMLTDIDVDSHEAAWFDQEIRRGKVFVSVDTRVAKGKRDLAQEVLTECGGRGSEVV